MTSGVTTSRSRRPAWRPASSSTRSTTSTACSSSTAPRATSARRRCARCASVKTVYLGTSEFAAGVLERMPAPELVVTRPDRPAGRGREVTPRPVALRARERGLEVFQPANVNDDEARARIAAVQPDAVVICAFGALLKEPFLSEHLMLSAHPSLLPRWRGAAPVERAIMAGDAETGVSIMRPTEGFDEGPTCASAEEPIQDRDD